MGTPRERARERTLAEIRELAWKQVEGGGAAALSLRAIARELGVVSSAIYRYVASREDLVTLLLIEGFNELADAVEAADAGMAPEAFRERWLTTCRTVRAWALARPAAWGLLYGGPVPGYYAPMEQTAPPAARVVLRQGAVLLAARAADALHPRVGPVPSRAEVPSPLRVGLEALAAQYGVAEDGRVVALGLLGWVSMLGVISAEVFEQLGIEPSLPPDPFAELQFASIADAIGL